MTRILLAATVLLAGCAHCGDFREDTAAGRNTQLAHYCFNAHADLAAAVATGKLDVSKLSAAPFVCLQSKTEIPKGAVCPQQ